MRNRSPSATIDVVLCAPGERELTVLLVRAGGERTATWSLPWAGMAANTPPDAQARRIAEDALGARAGWMEQVGAVGGDRRHPSGAALSVAYVAVTPRRAAANETTGAVQRWFAAGRLPPLAPRHRELVAAALAALRTSLDSTPVAFALLAPTFTLSELQSVYEMLAGRRLHKASFRRALHAAQLVAPTKTWRSEGRGRPAQLFELALRGRGRRNARRGVRFDQSRG